MAQAAKKSALKSLRDRPPLDPKFAAERQAALAVREAAAAERQTARQLATIEAKAAKQAAGVAKSEGANVQEGPLEQSASDLKAARDARYAARKVKKR